MGFPWRQLGNHGFGTDKRVTFGGSPPSPTQRKEDWSHMRAVTYHRANAATLTVRRLVKRSPAGC